MGHDLIANGSSHGRISVSLGNNLFRLPCYDNSAKIKDDIQENLCNGSGCLATALRIGAACPSFSMAQWTVQKKAS
jgi:hypothetical protein